MRLVVVVLITLVGIHAVAAVAPNRPVTNEDIRDAILSVVHMIRSTEDKLERHEYRERALGDQIKKALTTIDKRQKLLDPVKGTLSRIDERLAAVETILMQKDERERLLLQKTSDFVEQIHQNLPKMFDTLKHDITSSFPRDEPRQTDKSPSKIDLENLQKEIGTKIDNVSQNVVKNIEQIREDNKNNLLLNVHVSENLEDVKRHINTSEQVLEKYENKLAEYNNHKDKNDIQANILQALDLQGANVAQILTNIKTIASKVPKVAEVADVQAAKNDALKLLEQLRKDLSAQTSSLDGKLTDTRKLVDTISKLPKTIDLQPKILQAIEQQKTNVDQILANVKGIANKVPAKIAEVTDVQAAKNETVKAVEQVKKDVVHQISVIETKIKDVQKSAEQNSGKLQKTVDSIDTKTKNDSQLKILQAIEQQKTHIEQILTNIKNIANKVPTKIADVDAIKNEALKSLEQIKKDLSVQTAAIESRIDEARRLSEQNNAKLQKTIDEVNVKTINDMQPRILQALEQQRTNVDDILSNVKTIDNKIADVLNLDNGKTDIIKSLDLIKGIIDTQTSQLEQKLAEIKNKGLENSADLHKIIANSEVDMQPAIFQVVELQKASLDKISNSIQNVADKVLTVAEVKDVDSAKKEALSALDQIKSQVNINTDIINRNLQDIQLATEENKASLNKTLELLTQNTTEPAIVQAVEQQNKNIEQILSDLKLITDKLPTSESPDAEIAKNETLQSLQEIKGELLGQALSINNKVTALQALTEKNSENLQKTIIESGEMAEQLNANVATSFEKLSNSVQSLSKLDQVMIQTADAVLDTKRRVEYGIHQILLEVSTLVKKHSKEVNSTINSRFDKIESSLLDPEGGALANLTTRISGELDQVWRQIGIMHQQMGANTDTLEQIQTQTDSYINGSAITMDNMRGKVVQITSSMAEVDDNLNYLLGRLSLVTQEFNRIKSGLGEALDQIKGSFNAVQQKLRDPGPGPHQIASSELEGLPYNQTNTG